ncbi:MAG: 50S ribosomal protein L10 [Bacilli bacterium]|jgi:large subunit ribosomal protein L10|nr:50S ribosomal protein L10 [Bacilli bacterium]
MNEQVLEGKKQVVSEIQDKIKNAETVVLFEYQGLSVKDFEDLRNQLRNEGVEVRIYKNRLAKIAANDMGHEKLTEEMTGPNAIAFSNDDAVAGPRIIAKFSKDHEAIKIKTGIVEGDVVDESVILELASLPSREGLLSMLLSCLQAPARDMALVVDALAKQKGEDAPVEEAKPAEEVVEEVKEDTPAEENADEKTE